MYYENVLATIGKTPLIKLNKIAKDIPGLVLAKVEAFNPGQSAKDRIALYMIEEAERAGKLKPGATVVEATSGNTGYSIAMVSSLKGYKCVLTVTSKASPEKISLLRSMGAEVVVCPVEVEPEDPRSYYSRAEQISRDIPGAYYLAQNFNLDNADAHYHSTGPEIWEQTEGRITHYICCAGTGGTLSGTARFLKEQNPDIKIIGVDAYGSVLKKYWETGIYDRDEIRPYKIEGLGKNIIPDNMAFDLVDDFIKVTDRASAHRCRQLARLEGLFVGYSAGSAMQCVYQIKDRLRPTDVVVALFPDHGSRYLGKVYNDDWMKQQGFLGVQHPTSQYDNIKRVYKSYRIKYQRYLRQTLGI
ncbi:MAG: cysteine synthase family protein [Saprospiraceae bacterium]|nr:cysteine synthase family protein [Saprospiraceae bacterium]